MNEHYHYTISQGAYSDYDEAWVVGSEAISAEEFRGVVRTAVLLVAEEMATKRPWFDCMSACRQSEEA